MRKTVKQILMLSVVLVSTACASGGSNAAGTGGSRRQDLITQAELQRGQFTNLYDAVQNLRSRWLNSRGPDTLIGRQGEIQVHMDDTRLGGLSALRNLPTVGVVYMQWFNPVDAAARWGLDHGHGAIVISTRPR